MILSFIIVVVREGLSPPAGPSRLVFAALIWPGAAQNGGNYCMRNSTTQIRKTFFIKRKIE
jgi:hypothetical protein